MKTTGHRQIALSAALALGTLLSTAAAAQSYAVLDLGLVSARALNDNGQVAGLVFGEGSTTAFITGANGLGQTFLTLPDGGTHGAALGLNNLGQVVGSYQTSAGETHGFVTSLNGLGLTDLFAPDGQFTSAQAINAYGQVTGSGPNEAFVSTAGNWQSLGTLGGTYSHGQDINANGQVVGYSATANGDEHAFITTSDGSGLQDLGTLGGSFSVARAINANGLVVGMSSNGNDQYHAFVADTSNGGMLDLTPDAAVSEAISINDQGQVVGYFSNDPFGLFHAFVASADGNSFIDLTTLIALEGGDTLSTAVAINRSNQILAEATNGHSYLLTPSAVPEPGSVWSMLLGLVGLGWLRRKR